MAGQADEHEMNTDGIRGARLSAVKWGWGDTDGWEDLEGGEVKGEARPGRCCCFSIRPPAR